MFRQGRFFIVIGLLLFCLLRAAEALADGIAQVSVNVYNDANVPGVTLARAEDRASCVFQAAGVHIEWINASGEENPSSRFAQRRDYSPSGASSLSLRVVPRSLTLTDLTFGVSFLGADGFGRYGDIFYETAYRLSETTHVSLADVLGHVIAHELGHLLLGTNAHAPAGIMRPHWSTVELHNLTMGRLLFTPQQSQRMKDKLGAETISERASHSTGLSFPSGTSP